MIMFGDHRTRYEPENQLKSTQLQLQLSQTKPEARCPNPMLDNGNATGNMCMYLGLAIGHG